MLNTAETAVGKIEKVTRKADNTKIVERRTIAGGKTAAGITIMEAIKANIIATAEFRRGKQGDYSFKERVFIKQVTVITTMTVV